MTRIQLARENSFDFLRLIAALSVLIAHQLSMAGVYYPEYGPPTIGPWGPKLADAGLYTFFALSGYLNCHSLRADPRVGRFAAARVLRIYPGAIANTIVCIFLGSLMTSVGQSEFWRSELVGSYALHNTLILYIPTQFSLPGYLTQAPFPAVNTPIWTLKYELSAYLGLALLYLLSSRLKRLRIVLLALICVGMVGCFYFTRAYPRQDGVGLDSLGSFYFVHAARFFTIFSFGALYAAIEQANISKFPLIWTAFGFQFLALLVSDPLARIAFIILMAIAAIELGKSSLLYSKIYAKVGDLSYGTYLYAFPVQMITVTFFLNAFNFWWLFLIDVLIILLIAKLSWTLIERPALRLKKRL